MNTKQIPWNKGKKMSLEQRAKLSAIKLIRPVKYWLGKKRESISGEKHYCWKGDDVSYQALHCWLTKKFGKYSKCDICGTTKANNYDWACKEGNYTRNREDYLRLCRSCHMKHDKQHEKMWKTRRSYACR